MEVNFFLKYATEFTVALTGFFAGVGGLFAIGKKKIDNVRTELKNEIVSEMDSKQNTQIEKTDATLNEVLKAIQAINAKVDIITSEVSDLSIGYQKLNRFMETQQERETFKALKRRLGKRIEDLVYAYIAEVKFNSAFESMLIKGGEESKTFFCNLMEEGFNEMNIVNAKKRAKAVLRSLRSQNSGNTFLSMLCVERIKLEAAAPAMERLWTHLVVIKTTKVEIDHYKEYEDAVIEYLEDFISTSAKIYKEENKDLKE